MARVKRVELGDKSNQTTNFVGREEHQELFYKALKNINETEHKVLHFYGVGGIGKSSLQRRLQERLKTEKESKKSVIYTQINFANQDVRKPAEAFRVIAQKFSSEFGVDFRYFTLAYMIYLKKAGMPIVKEALPFKCETIETLSGILNFIGGAVGGLFPFATKGVEYIFKKANDFFINKKIKTELANLGEQDFNEIEKELPRFLYHDLKAYRDKNPNTKIVIFLDTYEALWENDRKEANDLTKDEWIRNFIDQTKNVLFITSGREKLKWFDDDKAWENDLEQCHIEGFSKTEAKSFLVSRGIEDENLQDAIYEGSSGVPFYLELCVEIYRRDSGVKAEEFSLGNGDERKLSDLFLKYLNDNENATLEALSVATFFNEDIFKLLIGKLNTGYPATRFDRFTQFSFISEDSGRYFIHSLMKETLSKKVKKDDKKDVIEVLSKYYNEKLENLDMKNLPSDISTILNEAFKYKKELLDFDKLSEWFWGIFTKFSQYRLDFMLLDISLEFVDIQKETLGENHSDTAGFYNNIGVIHYNLCNFKEALKYHEKALKARREALGENHKDLVASYGNIGNVYYGLGDYKEALKYHEKALNIQKEILGENNKDIATYYNNIGVVYSHLGNYEEALGYHKKALNIQKETIGENHPDTAISYNNIGNVYYILNKPTRALRYYKRTLSIRKETIGENHPDTAISYNNIGNVYYSFNRLKEALKYHEKALKARRETIGENHQDTASSYNNIGNVHYNSGDLEEALKYYEKALSIKERILGENHLNTASSYNNIGFVYYDLGNSRKALEYCSKAYEIFKEALGENHPQTQKALEVVKLIKQRI
ncbi:MAG: ATP-binding protein [Campylobacteraceae bacterium]|nr:ATP-binding protein [Campylobacteraceae bacterium]